MQYSELSIIHHHDLNGEMWHMNKLVDYANHSYVHKQIHMLTDELSFVIISTALFAYMSDKPGNHYHVGGTDKKISTL